MMFMVEVRVPEVRAAEGVIDVLHEIIEDLSDDPSFADGYEYLCFKGESLAGVAYIEEDEDDK